MGLTLAESFKKEEVVKRSEAAGRRETKTCILGVTNTRGFVALVRAVKMWINKVWISLSGSLSLKTQKRVEARWGTFNSFTGGYNQHEMHQTYFKCTVG